MLKHQLFALCAILILIASVQADISNGDFSNPLSTGWTVDEGTVIHWPYSPFSSTDPAVLFSPNSDEAIENSTLSQMFPIYTGEEILSFDVIMPEVFEGGETDVFTASLLNTSDAPLISVTGQNYFFLLDSSGTIDDSIVSIAKNTVSLDVSSLVDQNAKLVFNLYHDYSDQDTVVFLDNVALSAIPAPGAMMLAGIGLGCFGYLRRRKTI
jgi:hypothetical protein